MPINLISAICVLSADAGLRTAVNCTCWRADATVLPDSIDMVFLAK